MKTDRASESVAPLFYSTFTLENTQLTETGAYPLSYKPPVGKRFQTISSFNVALKEGASG